MDDDSCDLEVNEIFSKQRFVDDFAEEVVRRILMNPVAHTLSVGDEMVRNSKSNWVDREGMGIGVANGREAGVANRTGGGGC